MSDQTLGIVAPHPPIMVPEAGGDRARVTSASARALAHASRLLHAFEPDTIVLMSPHAPVTHGAFVVDDSARTSGDLGAFGASSVTFDLAGDPELAGAIVRHAQEAEILVVPRSESESLLPGILDHGSMVPLSFLDRSGKYALVVLSVSLLSLPAHREIGAVARRAAADLGRRAAFVASGDCSHRLTRDAPAGWSPRAAEFDAEIVSLLSHGDFEGLAHMDHSLVESAGECGLRSFVALGGFIAGSSAETRVLAYESPWGVGYLSAVSATPGMLATPPSDLQTTERGPCESAPVAIARQAIETYVRERRVTGPRHDPDSVLASRAGVFVSLHREGELRGCIGTTEPTRPTLADEIVHNAIQAATADSRFQPLAPAELAGLEISVDVLYPAESATFADLDPRTYGVIVSADSRRGLLLPDLDGVDDPAEQVSIALRKAGIGHEERYKLERFRVDRYR